MDYDFEAPTYVNFAEAMDEDESEVSRYFGMTDFPQNHLGSYITSICFISWTVCFLQMSSMKNLFLE